jgi:hypothetical protein
MRAEGFSAATGLRGGVQGNLPKVRDVGVTARIDYSPILGSNFGIAGYYGGASQGDPSLGSVSVSIASADARLQRAGFQFRGQFAYVYIHDAVELNKLLFRISAAAGPVSRQLLGGYVEGSYDLLRPLKLHSGMQLVAFFRYDRTNTQFDVPESVLSAPRQPGCDRSAYVTGLTFKPIFEVAVKADYTYRHTEVAGSGTQLVNFALAYQF